ncbi:MAG: LPS assembly protein LptD [Pseudomonadota bacterium]|nr:LPS assembly protein LptD [Pseudomonadota bacterium]
MALGALWLLAGAARAQTPAPEPAPAALPPLALHATPLLAERLPAQAEPVTIVRGDRITGRAELETVIEGQAELRRPGLTVLAEQLSYDHSSDIATATGGVRINQMGNRYTGTEARVQVDAFEGFVLQPTYHFLVNGGHGQAERLDMHDPDRATAWRGDYTTCVPGGPGWVPDWILRADRLDIDQEADEGRAHGAVLSFKGVPLLPLPAVSFPLTDRRKSGWLPPTVGLDNKSGFNLTLPYYWNIAPNRDATFSPELMVRRGVNLGGQFRYLENNYAGRVDAHYMPNDRLRERDRWGYFVRHHGSIDTGLRGISPLGLNLNLNRVSDNDHWRDFSRAGLSLTTRLLANDGSLGFSRGDFSFVARALKWQTLQTADTDVIVPPYDRLPQLTGRFGRINDRGFDYAVETDFTRFRGDRLLTRQPDAERAYLHAQLSHPFVRPWGFFTPKVQLHSTHYRFNGPLANGAASASRTVPTVSLDGGLVFERDASYFGRGFRQTLEPRLMYVYTPHRDQRLIPNYDTGAYDFNFATIWAENAFAGHDRVVDNNLVTAGLTTRLLDPATGAEAVRLGLAQRYRFSPQEVVLPGGMPTNRGLSDLMLGGSIQWDPRWAFDTVVQYNHDTHRNTRTTVQTRYSPGPYRTVSLAYRHQRDLGSESVDLGWQWPLSGLFGGRAELGRTRAGGGGGSCSGTWYSVGRLNYSVSDSKLVDAILGVEYDAGCWIGRVVLEKLNSTTNSSTKRIMFQLEFVGLSRIGSNPLSSLRNNIPRYQYLRHETVAPSRFMSYE